ncbi:MAG TPA: hypothetical protein VGB21_01540, partial [Candidatus Methylomirabilis sp.]
MVGWEHAIGDYHLGKDQFLSDLVEAVEFQVAHCEIYHFLCARQGFSPSRDLRQEADLARIPYLTSGAFKESRR